MTDNRWDEADEAIVNKVASSWGNLIRQSRQLDLEDFKQEVRVAWLELRQDGRATENALRDRARAIVRKYGYEGRTSTGLRPKPQPIPASELRADPPPGKERWSEEEMVEHLFYQHDGQPQSMEREILRELFWEWLKGLNERDQALLEGIWAKTYSRVADELGYADHTGALYRARHLLRNFMNHVGANDAADLRALWG